jgi:hypothetical protein
MAVLWLLVHLIAPIMDEVGATEMLVNFYRTTQHYDQEHSHFHLRITSFYIVK